MKKVVNTHQAKTQFSLLLRRVAAGEEIIIANRGVPVARLGPLEEQKAKRQLGFYEGKFTVPDDFDAPLPDEILDAFDGKEKPRGRRHEIPARHQRAVVERCR